MIDREKSMVKISTHLKPHQLLDEISIVYNAIIIGLEHRFDESDFTTDEFIQLSKQLDEALWKAHDIIMKIRIELHNKLDFELLKIHIKILKLLYKTDKTKQTVTIYDIQKELELTKSDTRKHTNQLLQKNYIRNIIVKENIGNEWQDVTYFKLGKTGRQIIQNYITEE